MASQSPEELQKEFNTVRNKQVEIFDRLGQIESQIRQLTENMRKLEDIVNKLDSSSQRKNPYQR
jgi:predicted nuclease with TOPRIM domain